MQKLKTLLQNPTVRKFFALFSTDVLVRGANFLLIPVFLLLMSKQDFGIYGYLYNFAMTCSLILNLGYQSALPKLYTETSEKKKDHVSMLFTLSITLFGFLLVLFAACYICDWDSAFFNIVNRNENANFDYSRYRPYLFIAIASMIFSNFLTYYFISAKKVRSIQIFNIIRLVACNLTVIVLLYFSKDADTAMLRLAATYVIEFLLCCVFAIGVVKEFAPRYNKFYMRKALKIGLPISFVGLINAFVNFGDKQFVMLYGGSEAMGAYNLAFLIATIPLIVFQSFNFVWLPDFLGEKDLPTLKRKSSRNAKIIFSLLLALSALIWGGTFLLLRWGIFPENYFEVVYYLPMLLLAQVFAAMILYYFNFFTYFENTYISMIISIIAAIAGYLLYSQGAQRFGVVGIASSLAIINLTTTIIYIAFSKYHLQKGLHR